MQIGTGIAMKIYQLISRNEEKKIIKNLNQPLDSKEFIRNNLKHPTYLTLAELGKAIKTIFLRISKF